MGPPNSTRTVIKISPGGGYIETNKKNTFAHSILQYSVYCTCEEVFIKKIDPLYTEQESH